LEQLARFEDPRVREAIIDRVAVSAGQDKSRVSQDGKVLAHVRDVTSDAAG
jgi:hypothetical protein